MDNSSTTAYLFDINTLMTERDFLLKKEAADRILVNSVESPDTVSMKSKLVEWATNGFPDGYPVYSITLVPPEVCSDGVKRQDLLDYAEFLVGTHIVNKMLNLQKKLNGIRLDFSTTQDFRFILQVFKAN